MIRFLDVNHLKKFLLGMKSLKESLFDNNIKKELTIRDVYELDRTSTGFGVTLHGVPIDHFFDIKKLLKYPNPYILSNVAVIASMVHLLGIVADQPAPIKSTIKTSDHKWCENLKKILTGYIKRSWKDEWDKKINIYLIEYPNNCFGVSIDYGNGDGSYEFRFKPKES